MAAFVSDESFEKGRRLEAMLTNAPRDLGVLFASVAPSPIEGGKSRRFVIVIGVSRERTKEMVLPIVMAMFVKEQEDGSYFSVEVVRGTVGAGAHETVPRPS